MNQEEKEQIMKSASNQQTRFVKIANSIRCLDCTGMQNSIEYVESPIARDQRALVQMLLRKGKTDKEIYQEMSGIFGRHSIMAVQYKDPYSTKEEAQEKLKALSIVVPTIGAALLSLRFLHKYLMK